MITIMRVTEMYDKDVYTDAGEYFGKVDDVVLGKFMVNGWIIKSTPNSLLREALGDVRAVIVPHKAVRAVGDVMLISHDIELTTSDELEDDEDAPKKEAPPAAATGTVRASPFQF